MTMQTNHPDRSPSANALLSAMLAAMQRFTLVTALVALFASFTVDATMAQSRTPFAIKGIAAEGGFYEPGLDFYAESPNYLLDFSTGPMGQVHLEVELFEAITVRGSVGYWSQSASDRIGVDDPENARTHEASLRIVPISGTAYYTFKTNMGPRPVLGVGMTQNLIQRTFDRDRLDGSTSESFEANARNFSYYGMLGLHQPLAGNVWLGLESRFVIGDYQEEAAGDVTLDGWQFGLSLRYQLTD